MAIKFNSNMTVVQVLEGTKQDILDNLDLLAEDFFEKTGRKLNKGCSACVIEAVLTLKNLYKMTQFKFKRQRGCYKNKKGDKATISNSTMTDVKAIEFLETNPERIELFSEYPSNWKDLVAGKAETEEMKKIRIAIEAEEQAAKEAAEKKANKKNLKPSDVKKQNKEAAEKLEKARKEAQEKLESFVSGAEGCSSEEEVLEAVGELPEIERGVFLQSLKEKKEASEGSDETGSDDDSDNDNSGDVEKPSREELLKKPLKELRALYPEVKATSIEAFVDKVLAE